MPHQPMKLFYLLLLCLPFLAGCDSMLCTKGDSKQGLFFSFDPLLKTVDIGSYPTYTARASWVKKIIVKWDGFLTVESQGTVHCDNMQEIKKNPATRCKGHKIVQNLTVRRYRDGKGYEEWDINAISEKEWSNITDLNHKFSKPPLYHYENCRHKLLGGLHKLWQTIKRV